MTPRNIETDIDERSKRKRLLALPVLLLASALAWSALGTFSSAAIGAEQPTTIARAHSGSRAPTLDKPVYILVLGGDARTPAGNPARTRMDSIHILTIVPPPANDPNAPPRASVVGIPRDSYVPIPGRGSNKINAAGSMGGPSLVVDTMEAVSGCRFDYYMLTSFKGFMGLINQIGGVTFTVPRGGHVDPAASANFRGGTQRFTGREALAWSRSRKTRPRGDFDRSLAQGELMVATLREARKDFAANPGTALRNLAALRKHLRLDIPLAESLRLGLYALKVDPKNVENIVIDGAVGTAGSASVVRITSEGRSQLADVCADGLLGN